VKRLNNLSEDSLATLLIYSNLVINSKEKNIRPYTLKQWNTLVDRLINSSLRRPAAFFHTDEEDWARELYLSPAETYRLKQLLSNAGQLGIELDNLSNMGIGVTTRAEGNYPKRLKAILKKKSPPIIFYCGDINIANNKGVAIVGSRDVDSHGLVATHKIAQKCVLEGFSIISGGAKGVDTAAQNAALQSNGKAVAFIADSMIQRIKKKEIREKIISGDLLILSAVNPKSRFTIYSAMERNKYIYALSRYAIVISSDLNKGGTWTGATENIKNQWVPLFVRKEDNIPEGNKELLKIGAKPIDSMVYEDERISIKDWFDENAVSKNNHIEYEQLNLTSFENAIIREDG